MIASGAKSKLGKAVKAGDEVTARDICIAAKAGDKASADIMEETGKLLGAISANMLNILNVERIVFAGGVTKAGSILLKPIRDDVPPAIGRACLDTLAYSPALAAPLVPIAEAVHERVIVEVMRGCPNACRFCQAGATRLPVRTRSVDDVVETVGKALDATGYREISLLSLSTSDYPDLDDEQFGRDTLIQRGDDPWISPT